MYPQSLRALVLPAATIVLGACSKTLPTQDGGPNGGVDGGLVVEAQSSTEARRVDGGETGAMILFGDLHTHTFYSLDAFSQIAIHPTTRSRDPAEACDFARYCAKLDFFGNSDHAETLTPELWRRTRQQLESCQGAASQAGDLFHVLMGFEWTMSGATGLPVYGHKNVFFKGLGAADLPARPIGSFNTISGTEAGSLSFKALLAKLQLEGVTAYPMTEFQSFMKETVCDPTKKSPDLPESCYEVANTPAVLFRKLREWGLPAVVIPHGTAWVLAPAQWQKQLNPLDHDPSYQRLVEVYSQHGNSEQYRSYPEAWAWVDPVTDAACTPGAACQPLSGDCGTGNRCINGRCETAACQWLCIKPPSTSKYLPCCWRVVQLAATRPACVTNPGGAICQALKRAARRYGPLTFQAGDDLLDCGQCPDCFQPAFLYQPTGSVQAALAMTGFDGGQQTRYRWGFIGATDGHRAFPGSVVETKEFAEVGLGKGKGGGGESDPGPIDSFFYAGGMVAVHVTVPRRESLWEALRERRVYGTSGARILLWFDLLQGSKSYPMGSEVKLSGSRSFRVRAMGDYPLRPGCPAELTQAKGKAFVDEVCSNSCYWPDTTKPRLKMLRVEMVRIRRQSTPTEALAPLIEDPWKTIDCPPDKTLCEVTFLDDKPPSGEVIYYVRGIQEPTLSVNGDPLRCTRDASGRCIATKPCNATDPNDSCLTPSSERAWSSPIYVTP